MEARELQLKTVLTGFGTKLASYSMDMGGLSEGKAAGDVKLTIYRSEVTLPTSLSLFSCASFTIRKARTLISET
jgi:hypothetical protein